MARGRRASGGARALVVVVLALGAVCGSVVSGPGYAARLGGTPPPPTPARIADFKASIGKAIASESEALSAITTGDKDDALLALSSANRDLNSAEGLLLPYVTDDGSATADTVNSLLTVAQLVDELEAAHLKNGVVPTSLTDRSKLDRTFSAVETWKRDALNLFVSWLSSESTGITGGMLPERPDAVVDVLRGPTGEVGYFGVADPDGAGDKAVVAFTTPSGAEHTISLTLNSHGEAAGETPVPVASEIEITVKVTVSPSLPAQTNSFDAREDDEFFFTSLPTAPPNKPTPSPTPSTPATPTGTSTAGSSPGCAVVHPQQSCSFTARGSTIVLAGTGKGALLIENEITKQGSSFPAPTTATFTPIPGDAYTVRNYSNADMTVRQS